MQLLGLPVGERVPTPPTTHPLTQVYLTNEVDQPEHRGRTAPHPYRQSETLDVAPPSERW